jgi:hypothetical protein
MTLIKDEKSFDRLFILLLTLKLFMDEGCMNNETMKRKKVTHTKARMSFPHKNVERQGNKRNKFECLS